MFRKRNPKSPPKPRSAPESTGAHKRPTAAEEERTEALKILLGETDLALEKDLGPGSDPHDNTGRLSVKRLRSK